MPPEPGKSRSVRKQPPGRSSVRERSRDGGAGGRGGSQPPLSPPAESTSSRTTGESRRYPPGDVSPQDAESAKKDAEGEEEGGMGRRGNTSTDPFPLRTQRHSQAMLQTRLREDRQAHPQQSARSLGSCPQAVTALTNRAEANGELRSISHLKCLMLAIVY